MAQIFYNIFTDVHFLGAFIQTIVLIFLGFILRRKGIFTDTAKSVLTTLVWKVTVPCFAFNAFMQDFDSQVFSSSITIFVLGIILYIVLIFGGKLIFIKQGKEASLIGGLFLAIGQTTLFSMPILQSVYEGRAGYGEIMLNISTFSIVFRIFVYIVSFTLISGEKLRWETLGASLKKIFITPVMIGMISGIICFLIQNSVPFVRIDKTLPALYVTISTLTKMMNPCAMLLIGVGLGQSDFKSAFSTPLAWILAAFRNFIAPVLIAAISLILYKTGLVHFTEYSFTALVIGFSAPISVTLSVICMQYHKEEQLAARAVLLSTLMTLISLPLAFVLVNFCTEVLM